MANLSVNVNKIALLRNARGGTAPDLMGLSRLVVEQGVPGLTVHPRADRRHITPDDARAIRRGFPLVEVNFEGDLREEFLELVMEEKPDQCTLVPVSYGELTSNRGWDVAKWAFLLRPVIDELHRHGVRVSLFVEADPRRAREAADVGADRIEIYTGPYAEAFHAGEVDRELPKIIATAQAALAAGVAVNAGHDLTSNNLPTLIQAVPFVAEVSIGHHLVSDALTCGLADAVRRYRDAARAP